MEPNYSLQLQIESCRACRLGSMRTLSVPAEVGANYQPGGIAFMCEAPGAQEDATGRPLVGPAGRLFDAILADCGLRRDDVLLINRVRCRPPRNRLVDYPDAILACDIWTQAELAAYNPGLVVLMGATALKPVFGNKKVGEVSGQIRATDRLWVATYHPASVLRGGGHRDIIVADITAGLAAYHASR